MQPIRRFESCEPHCISCGAADLSEALAACERRIDLRQISKSTRSTSSHVRSGRRISVPFPDERDDIPHEASVDEPDSVPLSGEIKFQSIPIGPECGY